MIDIILTGGRPRIVDIDPEFRQLASEWHSGQWSPLYSYSSTGSIIIGLCNEIRGNLNYCLDHFDHVDDIDNLRRFLGHVAPIEDRLADHLETLEDQ